MNCPNDNTTLVMSDRQGIEIDYCPQCRGVWLDRGELDKLIERAAADVAPARPAEPVREVRPAEPPRYAEPRYTERRDDRHYDSHHKPHKKHKESFLGDMFDF